MILLTISMLSSTAYVSLHLRLFPQHSHPPPPPFFSTSPLQHKYTTIILPIIPIATTPHALPSPLRTIATTHGSAASRCIELARPRTCVVAGGCRSCRRRCNQITTLVNFLQDTNKTAWRQNTYKSAIYTKWLSRNRDRNFA